MNTIDGVAVKTATKPITIHISAKDCKLGQNKDPGACAAALALLRVKGCTQARVHLSRVYLRVDNKWLKFRTPGALRSEIVAFDRGGTFEPGEYQLNPLSPSERAKEGKAHTLGAPKKGRPGHHRAKHHTVSGVRHHGANR